MPVLKIFLVVLFYWNLFNGNNALDGIRGTPKMQWANIFTNVLFFATVILYSFLSRKTYWNRKEITEAGIIVGVSVLLSFCCRSLWAFGVLYFYLCFLFIPQFFSFLTKKERSCCVGGVVLLLVLVNVGVGLVRAGWLIHYQNTVPGPMTIFLLLFLFTWYGLWRKSLFVCFVFSLLLPLVFLCRASAASLFVCLFIFPFFTLLRTRCWRGFAGCVVCSIAVYTFIFSQKFSKSSIELTKKKVAHVLTRYYASYVLKTSCYKILGISEEKRQKDLEKFGCSPNNITKTTSPHNVWVGMLQQGYYGWVMFFLFLYILRKFLWGYPSELFIWLVFSLVFVMPFFSAVVLAFSAKRLKELPEVMGGGQN